MSKTDNIFLIGPMGAGKTSVAKQLSYLVHFPYYDTDQEIEEKTGVSVSWIFEVETEAGFRRREVSIIEELTQRKNIILSTGGGSIVSPQNCEVLKKRGFVAYLTVGFEQQVGRTSRHRGHRPLIDYPDSRARLEKLNREREPLYQYTADKIYKTDNQTPKDVAEQIFIDFQKECAST